jgi:transposase InsO family protein
MAWQSVCIVFVACEKLGLRCKQKCKFKVTTDSKHDLPIAPNLLAQQFTVDAPDRVWTGDLTSGSASRIGCPVEKDMSAARPRITACLLKQYYTATGHAFRGVIYRNGSAILG